MYNEPIRTSHFHRHLLSHPDYSDLSDEVINKIVSRADEIYTDLVVFNEAVGDEEIRRAREGRIIRRNKAREINEVNNQNQNIMYNEEKAIKQPEHIKTAQEMADVINQHPEDIRMDMFEHIRYALADKMRADEKQFLNEAENTRDRAQRCNNFADRIYPMLSASTGTMPNRY